MLRKTLIALAAVAALGAAASAPTAASAKGLNIDVHFGGGGFGGGYGGGYGPYYDDGYYPVYGPDCYFKKVKVWSPKWDKFVWKTKQVCY